MITACRHPSHLHAHRADITHIHASQHCRHTPQTPLTSPFPNTTNTQTQPKRDYTHTHTQETHIPSKYPPPTYAHIQQNPYTPSADTTHTHLPRHIHSRHHTHTHTPNRYHTHSRPLACAPSHSLQSVAVHLIQHERAEKPHQPPPTCTSRVLHLHNLPDAITKLEAEIPGLPGRSTLASAQLGHRRDK